jgi:hypothetical protein
MIIEPKGGLHGPWVWKFRWQDKEREPFGGTVMGWITGEHEDPNKATENCEVCLRALEVERERQYKEWWDALEDDKG